MLKTIRGRIITAMQKVMEDRELRAMQVAPSKHVLRDLLAQCVVQVQECDPGQTELCDDYLDTSLLELVRHTIRYSANIIWPGVLETDGVATTLARLYSCVLKWNDEDEDTDGLAMQLDQYCHVKPK